MPANNPLAYILPQLMQQQMQATSPTGQTFQLPSLMQNVPLPSTPAANAFLDRFGPYRLQAFDAMRPAPQITGGGMGQFEARGLEASGLLDPPPVQQAVRSLFGGTGSPGGGRDGGGARSGGRGATKSGGKASGPGGPKGGRSGPVSR